MDGSTFPSLGTTRPGFETMRAALAARWPVIALPGQPRQPLAPGAWRGLVQYPGMTVEWARWFVRLYEYRDTYVRALANGGRYVWLNGTPAEHVERKRREWAQQEIARRDRERAEKAAAESPA